MPVALAGLSFAASHEALAAVLSKRPHLSPPLCSHGAGNPAAVALPRAGFSFGASIREPTISAHLRTRKCSIRSLPFVRLREPKHHQRIAHSTNRIFALLHHATVLAMVQRNFLEEVAELTEDFQPSRFHPV